MFDFYNNISYAEYGLSILLINILIYVFSTWSIFLIVLSVSTSSFNFLNSLKGLNYFYGYFVCFIVLLLSLTGVPPLLGFIGKFFIFFFITVSGSYLLLLIFFLLNLFALFFYLQNFRFLVSKNTNVIFNSNSFLVKNYDFSIFFILLTTFINVFGIFYFEDIFIVISHYINSL